MTIGTNSYGSLIGVAARAPRYANADGTFDVTTRPPAARVEDWINEVSAVVNSYLKTLGFNIPITQGDALLLMQKIVMDQVVYLVEAANGSGRFAPNSKAIANRTIESLIAQSVMDFLDAVAVGLDDMGATRPDSTFTRISFRDTNERGNATFPMFQRSGFGNSFTDWDSD